MKRTIVILTILLLIPLTLSACKPTEANSQKAETNTQITEASSLPEFFNDIGKNLNTLKEEHPEAKILAQFDGLPDAAAACLGEQEGKYVYYFFGTQDGNLENAMNKCGDQLKCAGFLTTADVLFPEMKDDMTFSDFFSLIDVSDYEYDSEEGTMQGVLDFKYNNMRVLINTNEITTGGGWNFTGIEKVKKSAPVSIIDEDIESQNYELAHPFMYE